MERQIPKPQLGGKPQQPALKQTLASAVAPVTSQLPQQSQCTPSSPQLLAHLTSPQSIRTSSTALPFHFPFTVSSLSPVTCAQTVGRLVCSQPITLANAGFTVVSPSSSLPALQVLGSNAFPGHLSTTGMMMLPTITTGQVKVSTSVPSILTGSVVSELACGVPLILQSPHSATPDLNFTISSPTLQIQQPAALLPTVSRSVSGTVHHKGVSGPLGDGQGSKPTVNQSPGKELTFTHLKTQLQQESALSHLVKAKRQRSDSSEGLKGFGMFESSMSSGDGGGGGGELPLAKKIKLEAVEVSDDSEVAMFRKQYCLEREKELDKRSQNYQALVTELYFLERGGQLMDYNILWMKRSNLQESLVKYLRERKAQDLGEYSGQEKSINNEVKVLTTSGGTLPIVTPVAISKTLPPAITAMQQQQQENGGIPLSTTAATTTVGSPPPYTVESSSSSAAVVTIVAVTTTVTMTSALPRARVMEGPYQSTVTHLADVYPSLKVRDPQPDSHSGLARASTVDLNMRDASAAVPTVVSQDAVIEMAKQEAQVMQRIAELRKQGLWTLKQLPKVQEPSRHMTQWDYLLEEMQWMAVDFAQERRFKMSCAKHLAVSITKQHDRRQQALKLQSKMEEQRLKSLARSIGKLITDFWSSMIEMALYKRQKDVGMKNRKIFDYVTRDLVAGNSDLPTAAAPNEPEISEDRFSSEIQDLITEGEMPLDELVQKYAGAFSKEFDENLKQLQSDSPDSSGSDSSRKNDSVIEMEHGDTEEIKGVEEAEMTSADVEGGSKDVIEQLTKTALGLQPTSNSCDLEFVDRCKSTLMKLKVRDYQLVGSNWLSCMHQHGIGCILGDETGLGKKVQAVHFLSVLASEHSNWGPHLIVAPHRSLFAWQINFARWCPALKLFVYFGDVQERVVQRMKWKSSECGHYHVCVTSLKCVTEDAEYFCDQRWSSLIIDQAEDAKPSEGYEALLKISTQHRLLLTDVSPLTLPLKQQFNLIMLTLSINMRPAFDEKFGFIMSSDDAENETKAIRLLREILGVICLRRLKQDVGGQLPKIETTTVMCPLSKDQQRLYSELTCADELKILIRDGNLSSVLSLMLKLKKLCNHPNLVSPTLFHTPVTVDGVSVSVPSLIDSALDKDLLNKTEAWSAMTSLVDLEVGADSHKLSLTPRLKPLIEELTAGGSSAVESSMDIDVETMDELGGSLADSGIFSDDRLKLTTLSIIKDGIDIPLRDVSPVYGTSLQNLLRSMTSALAQNDFDWSTWSSQGYWSSAAISRADASDSYVSLFNVSTNYSKDLAETLVPKVFCQMDRVMVQPLVSDSDSALVPLVDSLSAASHISSSQAPQLTLANSGKLQLLDVLIKQLMNEQRRLVILSHMSSMLDLLETYLDGCKLLYMRLDANTKVENCHLMAHRFNTNLKIFCFLVSSRTPFIGGFEWPTVDTVVLFDTDLSPSMNRHAEQMLLSMAQASNITVYKFIAEDTIEETLDSDALILRKGVLSDGKVTYPEEMLNSVLQSPQSVAEKPKTTPPMYWWTESDFGDMSVLTEDMFDLMVSSAEDPEDAKAALLIRAQGLDHDASQQPEDQAMLQRILQSVSSEETSEQGLTLSQKIQEFAVSVVERQMDMLSKDTGNSGGNCDDLLKLATPSAHKRKLEELYGADDNKENMEEEMEEEDNEENSLFLTYPMDRENKQVFMSDVTGEQMPLWMPPTPPQDDSDVYVDHSLYFLYEPSIMSESQLPPIYVKKGHKRLKMEHTNTRRVKVHPEEQHSVPRSLFARPPKSQIQPPARQIPEPPSDQPEWLIHEDWALLQAYQMHQDLPVGSALNITSNHAANWELVADVVNACGRTYRSAKQCKSRFENVILPREEGKFLYDVNARKPKSNKGVYKTKNNQPMRTNQLFLQDDGRSLTQCFSLMFDAVKNIVAKRTPVPPPSSGSSIAGTRNAKHIAVLADFGINYDQPLLPVHIATLRAERLQKDKKQAPAVATASASDQQPVMSGAAINTQLRQTGHQASGAGIVIQAGQAAAQTLLQTGQQVVAGQHIAVPQTAVVSAPLSGQDGRQQQMTIVQAAGQQLQTVASGQSALLATSLHKVAGSTASVVTSVSLPRSLTGIVVTQATALNRPQTVVTSATLVNLPGNLNQTVRTIRNVVPLTIRDSVTPAIAHNTINISAQDNRSLAQVIATTGLTTTQLVVTQQKPTAVGLSQLNAGPVQQHMLNLTGAAKSQNATTLPALQLQMRQQRVGPTMLQQVRPVQLSAVQVPNQMTALLRKQPQTKTAIAGSVQPSVNIQQIPRQQLIDGSTLQQQQQTGAASSTVSQSVTTLLKAVSPAASVSTVTIPVSAVSLGINVSHPKLLSGKAANSPQQVRQLQVPKRAPTVQFTASKVTALGPMPKSGSSPVILQTAQQRFLSQSIPARLQQVISSSSGTVIAAQIIHQSNAQQTLPASVALASASAKAGVTVTIAGTAGLSGIATIPMSSLCPVTNQTSAVATTTVKVMPTQAMYAKQSKDGFGIQKTTMVVSGGLQQVMVRPASAQQQQQQASSQLLQGAHITMATSGKTVASLTPVEKAVQEVVQQAQAQARQVPPISFSASNVTSAVPQGSQAQVAAAAPTSQHLLVTSVLPSQTIGTVSGTVGLASSSPSPAVGDDSQNKTSTPAAKPRGQRS